MDDQDLEKREGDKPVSFLKVREKWEASLNPHNSAVSEMVYSPDRSISLAWLIFTVRIY
jgi:hypothetical protein